MLPHGRGLFPRPAMLGAINWTARWFRTDGPRSSGAVAREVADYLLRGLAVAAAAGDERAAGGDR